MTVRYQIEGHTSAGISTSVETGVREGALAAGEPLPPVRDLAQQLRVSAGTVAAAYKLLRDRGIVETAGRNGTRVRSRPPVAQSRADRRLPVPPGVIDLSTGEPDVRLLPDPWPQLRALAAADLGPASYRNAGVLPALAAAAAARLAADGIEAPAITVTNGALDGIDRLLAAHLRPGDRVGVEDPGWANLLDLIAAQGLTPVPVPVDDSGPTPSGLATALRRDIAALVVTSRAHNPTGAALTSDRAAELRTLLHGHDLLVIEDDHAAELATAPLHALAGATERWAFLRSTSKPYGPDLRLAVLGGDETTIARVEGRMRFGSGWVSTVMQRVVLELWADPGVAALVNQARDSYRARREGLLGALAQRGVPAHGKTGINLWVPVGDETSAVTLLRSSGYAVAPGSLYRVASPSAVRISVSPLDLSGIAPLADAMADVLTGRRSRTHSA